MPGDGSKIVKYAGGTWPGVEPRTYKTDHTRHCDVTRRTLVGDAPDELATSFVTRVFDIGPGGYSTLERHEHPHTVVVLEGTGSVVLEGRTHSIAPFDCVYVAPGAIHQFQAGDERLVILCVVDRVRDRPQLPTTAQIRELLARGVPVKGVPEK